MYLRILIMVLLVACHSAYCQEFTFVFLNKKLQKEELPKEQVEKIQAGHMANIERLAKEGKLIAAGPFEGGGGIFIFGSASVEQVKEWLSTDPGVQAKRWDIEILPYFPRVGSVCTVKEPYEMVLYEFVRFSLNPSNDVSIQDAIAQHDQFLRELAANPDVKVIAEGTYGSKGGGMIVMNSAAMEKISDDPAVKKTVMTALRKKLYIARGAFCEK